MTHISINQRAIEEHVKKIAMGYKTATQRNPIRVPVQTEAVPQGGYVPRETAQGDPILARLLMWLDERAQQNPSGVHRCERVRRGTAAG